MAPHTYHKGTAGTLLPCLAGFTLIELSIVLLIIGLLAGGVITGEKLHHNAELRSVASELDRYKAATELFYEKYSAYPGDLTTAYSFWPGANSCTNADVNVTAAGCNGNGDGTINDGNESLRAWQHLALAEMIPGSYTGADSGVGGGVTPGINVPLSAISGAGFLMHPLTYYGKPTTLAVEFGKCDNMYCNSAIISPVDTHQLDVKLDDGLAANGLLQAVVCSGSIGSCLSSGDYDLTNSNRSCIIGYFFSIPQ